MRARSSHPMREFGLSFIHLGARMVINGGKWTTTCGKQLASMQHVQMNAHVNMNETNI